MLEIYFIFFKTSVLWLKCKKMVQGNIQLLKITSHGFVSIPFEVDKFMPSHLIYECVWMWWTDDIIHQHVSILLWYIIFENIFASFISILTRQILWWTFFMACIRNPTYTFFVFYLISLSVYMKNMSCDFGVRSKKMETNQKSFLIYILRRFIHGVCTWLRHKNLGNDGIHIYNEWLFSVTTDLI